MIILSFNTAPFTKLAGEPREVLTARGPPVIGPSVLCEKGGRPTAYPRGALGGSVPQAVPSRVDCFLTGGSLMIK